jgi:hypothetical protein
MGVTSFSCFSCTTQRTNPGKLLFTNWIVAAKKLSFLWRGGGKGNLTP